jgi:hypothetical protein
MTQGYIILGMNEPNSNVNIVTAAALAQSIRMHDPDREICVVVGKFAEVPEKYEEVFDYIIELPFGRTDPNSDNIFANFWQLYYMSPFDETMFINTYALITGEIASIWSVSNFDDIVCFSTCDFTGRQSQTVKLCDTDDVQLQKFGGDVLYFKKSERAAEFFKMADPVFKNWRHIYRTYTDNITYRNFDLTVLLNIVGYMLGEEYYVSDNFSYIDLSLTPDEAPGVEDSHSNINFWMDEKFDKVKINNYNQNGIFVYHEPELIDDTIMKVINGNSNTKNKKLVA